MQEDRYTSIEEQVEYGLDTIRKTVSFRFRCAT